MPRLDPEFRVQINGYLRKHHRDLCRHWFEEIEPIDIEGGVLRLLVREPVQLRYLQRMCTPQFTEAAQAVSGRLLAVRFVGPEEVEATAIERESRGSRPSKPPVYAGLPASGHRAAGVATSPATAASASPSTSYGVGQRLDTSHGGSRSAHALGEGGVAVAVREADLHPNWSGEVAAAGASPVSGGATQLSAGLPAGLPSGLLAGLATSPPAPLGGHGVVPDRLTDPLPALDEQTLLSPDYTFDTFVVGPGNRLAHAAAMAVADRPGRAYNPYFIHGGVGLGKTHLLQAVCQTILRKNPRARICYISCNTFMDLFHEAVRAGRMADFRSRFRTVDVLVIDDIHFLSKRDQTQEEFFHTFNALYQAGKQIVLSSDAAPSDIPDLEERLTSRFSCGLVARIDRPCYETRVAIVKTKAALHDLDIPEEVPAYIAARIDSNIRELEGALTKIRGLSMALQLPINLDLAKQALSDVSVAGSPSQPSIQMIIEEVSRFFDVKLTDLLSKRRHKSIALPRQVCMWLARKHTRYSLEEIGGYFGGRDHTTVMHAIKTINEKRGADGKLSADVSRVEEQLLQKVR